MNKIPKHIVQYYGSARKFRGAKRYAMRGVLRALALLTRGCAYSPGYREIKIARTALLRAADKQSIKNWG